MIGGHLRREVHLSWTGPIPSLAQPDPMGIVSHRVCLRVIESLPSQQAVFVSPSVMQTLLARHFGSGDGIDPHALIGTGAAYQPCTSAGDTWAAPVWA